MPCTKDIIPQVTFPVAIDIIKDIREHDGKSTGVHAKVLAKDHVTIYDHPKQRIPNYSECEDKTFLVFPDDNAISISEAFPKNEISNQSRIVFIDATWKQARQLAKSAPLSHLPRIKLSQETQTLYWRYQTGETDSNLATIEVHTCFLGKWAKSWVV